MPRTVWANVAEEAGRQLIPTLLEMVWNAIMEDKHVLVHCLRGIHRAGAFVGAVQVVAGVAELSRDPVGVFLSRSTRSVLSLIQVSAYSMHSPLYEACSGSGQRSNLNLACSVSARGVPGVWAFAGRALLAL